MLEFDVRKLFPRWYELGEDLKQTLKVVKLSQLVPPEVPIRPLDPEHAEELKKSIRSVGLVQPLLVTYGEEGKYTVLDGQHRLKALSEIAEETQKHPSEVPVTVVVLHTENQNARYGLILAAYQANRHHWRMGLPSLEEASAMVRAAFGQGGEDAFRQGLDFLRGLKAEDLEALLSVLLESSPVEALPVPDGPEQGFWKEAKKLSTGFRASLYLLEGVAEGNLPGFLRRLLSSTPPAPDGEEGRRPGSREASPGASRVHQGIGGEAVRGPGNQDRPSGGAGHPAEQAGPGLRGGEPPPGNTEGASRAPAETQGKVRGCQSIGLG